MPGKKHSRNLYGGLDILSTSSTPISSTYTPVSTTINPFGFGNSIPPGIDYLIRKNSYLKPNPYMNNPYLAPNPYYPDGSVTVTDFDDVSTVFSSEDEYGNIKNTIITKPIFNNPYDSSFITSWLPDYINPMISTYRDLNSDPLMKKKITKYFVTHVFDKWIKHEMSDLLNYLQVNNMGDVSFIKNINAYDQNAFKKDSSRDIENKIRFLEKYILTYEIAYKILSQYVHRTGVQWVNLPSQKHHIRKVLERKMIKMIKNAIDQIRG